MKYLHNAALLYGFRNKNPYLCLLACFYGIKSEAHRNNTFVYILSIDKEEPGSYNMIAKIFTEVKILWKSQSNR